MAPATRASIPYVVAEVGVYKRGKSKAKHLREAVLWDGASFALVAINDLDVSTHKQKSLKKRARISAKKLEAFLASLPEHRRSVPQEPKKKKPRQAKPAARATRHTRSPPHSESSDGESSEEDSEIDEPAPKRQKLQSRNANKL
jgi:hypothetical protein